MNEITTNSDTGDALLECLAKEARIYSESLAMNMFQLGRVYTEAKKLVKHGEWTEWIRQNGGMSERSAQQLMAVYARFGAFPAFQGLEKSKLFKMLSLPAGTEGDFIADNDIGALSSRAVEDAVRRVRAEMQTELDKEKRLREAAEAKEAELRDNPALPDDITDQLAEKDDQVQRFKNEIERVGGISQELMNETAQLRREKERLEKDLSENAELLGEVQEQLLRTQNDYLNMQSTLAKGDAERVPSDELTADVFANAVRQFIGIVARMPHMARVFGAMSATEKEAYDELLSTIENWAHDARKALDTIESEIITL